MMFFIVKWPDRKSSDKFVKSRPVGSSIRQTEVIPLLSLPYPALSRKRYPFTAGWQKDFSSRRLAKAWPEVIKLFSCPTEHGI